MTRRSLTLGLSLPSSEMAVTIHFKPQRDLVVQQGRGGAGRGQQRRMLGDLDNGRLCATQCKRSEMRSEEDLV